MAFWTRFIHPDVDRHLLGDEGEYVIDEVCKHWVTVIRPVAALVLCFPLFGSIPLWNEAYLVPILLGLVIIVWSMIRIHIQYMDRFVITNQRVFRVHGVLSQNLATMPISRILDISVKQPFIGRLMGYGHFVFESAAQDQGLRDITYVGDPERRDLIIQRVIQRAGLRANVQPRADDANEYDGV